MFGVAVIGAIAQLADRADPTLGFTVQMWVIVAVLAGAAGLVIGLLPRRPGSDGAIGGRG